MAPGRAAGPPLLFVYGTLMRGHALHPVLAGAATFLGRGHVGGSLRDLGLYPGLVAGTGRVRGEVYRVDRPEVLPALDEEEGYNFERRRTQVTLEDGRRVRAWVYRYIGGRAGAAIPGGAWRHAQPGAGRGARLARLAGRRRHS